MEASRLLQTSLLPPMHTEGYQVFLFSSASSIELAHGEAPEGKRWLCSPGVQLRRFTSFGFIGLVLVMTAREGKNITTLATHDPAWNRTRGFCVAHTDYFIIARRCTPSATGYYFPDLESCLETQLLIWVDARQVLPGLSYFFGPNARMPIMMADRRSGENNCQAENKPG
ncbi:hypothetical protein DFH06DRAFT_1133901 [Mycena polygramma]|nr:hypothetical protein DFH06DRAFT_1133901 [Mycena polygramma]